VVPAAEELTKKVVLTEEFASAYPLSILIAEDNLINQKLARHVLKKLGYEPQIANNGLEAVEMQKANSFNLILMDMLMPKWTACKPLKTIRETLTIQPQIVAMTANALPEDRTLCIEAGMDDYISKPFKVEILMEILKQCAGKVI